MSRISAAPAEATLDGKFKSLLTDRSESGDESRIGLGPQGIAVLQQEGGAR